LPRSRAACQRGGRPHDDVPAHLPGAHRSAAGRGGERAPERSRRHVNVARADEPNGGVAKGAGPAQGVDLSIVLPVYNERESLAPALAEYRAALADGGVGTYEILIVDDGSRDGTGDAAAQLARADPHLRVLRHERNQGQVAALRTGFAAARGRIVTHNAVDLPFAP